MAKADALITACIQSQDPASGAVDDDMISVFFSHRSAYGWYAKHLREFEALRAGIQPAFATVTTKEND